MTKNKSIIIFGLLGLAVLLFVLGIFDVAISDTFYKADSRVGHFFETTGEPPSIILFVFCVNFMLVFERSMAYRISHFVWGIIGLTYLTLKLSGDFCPTGAFSMYVNIIIGVIGQLILSLVFYYGLKKKYKERFVLGVDDKGIGDFCNKCRVTALCCIITLFVSFFLKAFWGRVRYRDVLVGKGEYSFFAIPQFFTGHFSFPSGHSANAACFMSVTYLVSDKKKLAVLRCILVVWLVLTAFSRLRLGAHYVTDIVTGVAVGLFAVWISPVLMKRFKKMRESRREI